MILRLIKAMRRTFGPHKGETYGYQCRMCKGHWKVYQQPYHTQNCKNQ